MIIQPSSSVTLYRNVAISDGEQIAFSSEASQKAYFAARKVVSLDNVTYVRRTGTIKMEWPTSTVSQCNYISFTNPAFENVTFYARIVDYNYINNVTTEISYAIDWFQSFMFKLQYDKCGILRQHLNQQGKQESDANPWKMTENTLELFTAEDLPVNQELLDRPTWQEGEDPGTSTGNTIVRGGTTRLPTLVLQIATFNSSQISTYPDFLKNFSMVINPDGTVSQHSDYFFQDYPDAGYTGYIKRSYTIFIRDSEENDLNLKDKPIQDIFDWLEFNGLTSSVIGFYVMGRVDVKDMLNDLRTDNSGLPEIDVPYPDASQWVNKKLALYPYNYLRCRTVAGVEKEYKWELFGDGYEGKASPTARFIYRVIGDNAPYRTIIPKSYDQTLKEKPDQMGNTFEFNNYSERLDSPPATQLPFATDSYLTFLSNKYMSAAAEMTSVQGGLAAFNASDIGAGVNIASDFIKTALSVGSQAISAGGFLNQKPLGANGVLMSPPSSGGFITSTASKADAGLAYNSLFGGGGSLITGSGKEPGLRGADVPKGTETFGPWTKARQAFVQSNYHPSALDDGGCFHQDQGFTPMTMMFIKQQLRPEIMRRYDKYFSLYGYSSRRYDLPWVCYFMQGSQDPTKLPAWDTSMGDAQTYIKTQDMHVFGVPEVIASQVEAIFDAGMFVKNGDTL